MNRNAQALARLKKGKRLNLTADERKRRSVRLEGARLKRQQMREIEASRIVAEIIGDDE